MDKAQLETLFDHVQALHSNELVEIDRFDMLKFLQQIINLIDERDKLLVCLQVSNATKTALLHKLRVINEDLIEGSDDDDQ